MKYNDNLIEYLCDKLLVTKKEFTKEELNSVDELVIDFYDYEYHITTPMDLNVLSDYDQSSEWLLTATNQNDYKAFAFDGTDISLSKTSSSKRLKFIVNLNKHTFYKSGTGTSVDPYIIK